MAKERKEKLSETTSVLTWPGGSTFGQSRERRPSDGAEYRNRRPYSFYVGDLAMAEILDDKVGVSDCSIIHSEEPLRHPDTNTIIVINGLLHQFEKCLA